MLKACGRCGKLHPIGYRCTKGRAYQGGVERELRHSWDWTKKSQEIRDKAQHLCEVCRDQGRYIYDGLEVHHIEKLSEHPEGLLDDYNLVCLCVEHHKQADAGELSQDYLKALAVHREQGTPPMGG